MGRATAHRTRAAAAMRRPPTIARGAGWQQHDVADGVVQRQPGFWICARLRSLVHGVVDVGMHPAVNATSAPQASQALATAFLTIGRSAAGWNVQNPTVLASLHASSGFRSV